MKKDIVDRKDLQKMVAVFYERLLKDDEFHKIFIEVAGLDLLGHMDILIDFWESALFQVGKYSDNLVQKHLDLNQKYNYQLNADHFDKWLKVFNDTVDDLFEGDVATGAKQRARSIATIIRLKIEGHEKLRLEFNN